MPAMWMRTPLGVVMPLMTRWKCGEEATTWRGMTPSVKQRPSE